MADSNHGRQAASSSLASPRPMGRRAWLEALERADADMKAAKTVVDSAITEAIADGVPITAIAERLGISRETIRKKAVAAGTPRRRVGPPTRAEIES